MRRYLVSTGCLLTVGAILLAQDNEPVIKVDVDLVSIFFTAREKKGGIIPDLAKDEVTVLENGKEQEIKSYTRETDLPLTMGLLVDVSRSQENLIEVERHAASQFFQQVLRPKDMAFLISFGAEAELLQDSTNSAALLRKGLDGLRVSTSFAGLHPGPVPTVSSPKGTILFDAVYLAAYDKLKAETGRKAIVVITDGVDQGSRYDVNQAIEAAHKSDAIIYSIYYTDPRAYGGFMGGGDGDLKKMSEETGGRVFRVDRKNTLDSIFDQIQQEMRSQYLLAYTPSDSARDGSFRKLEIKTKRKDLKIQARKGYYATAASD